MATVSIASHKRYRDESSYIRGAKRAKVSPSSHSSCRSSSHSSSYRSSSSHHRSSSSYRRSSSSSHHHPSSSYHRSSSSSSHHRPSSSSHRSSSHQSSRSSSSRSPSSHSPSLFLGVPLPKKETKQVSQNLILDFDRDTVEDPGEYQKLVEQELNHQEDTEDELLQKSRMKRQAILEKYSQKGEKTKVPNSPCLMEDQTKLATPPTHQLTKEISFEDEKENLLEGEENTILPPPPLKSSRTDDDNDENDANDEAGSWFLDADVTMSKKSKSDEDSPPSPYQRSPDLSSKDNQLMEEVRDEKGYFNFQPGALLGPSGRYQLIERLGEGQYSNVFLAFDGTTPQQRVAIKMLRHVEQMTEKDLKEVAEKELAMLNRVCQMDPEDKYSCVRLLDSFVDHDHLCIVFESLQMNLRELLNQYGRKIGLNIDAVRLYGRRLSLALYHLKKCDILHADFKLDNVLVGEDRRVVKLADFGCASFSSENVLAPYLVSRFYRPPEVILGLPYSFPMDLWSLGCTLFELFTGRFCFQGEDNAHMMKLFLDLKGLPSQKLLKKTAFRSEYFDDDFNFLWTRVDPLTKTEFVQKISVDSLSKQRTSPVRDLKLELLNCCPHPSNRNRVLQLVDLLEKIFVLDPTKRITIEEVLRHPFIRSK